ncbi:MAG: serine hydrolase domain-containing protein, partial [Micropepsaceae bacterium]
MRNISSCVFACVLFVALAVGVSRAADLPSSAAIKAEAARLMAAEQVVGMAVAVIDDGMVLHVGAYGLRNVERKLPLESDTVMYGASLTKAAFAYMILQLVDEGRIDLDASIAKYLKKPLPAYEDYADLAGDERWRKLTARVILNHATGFPNFRWLDDDKRLR